MSKKDNSTRKEIIIILLKVATISIFSVAIVASAEHIHFEPSQ
jgi:hypothetical protein